jgi:hypothetical protein
MLHYFTWQAFLVAALILTLTWYAVVILLFYRKELNDFLSGNHPSAMQPEPLTHAWDEEFEDDPLADEENLIGKPVMPEGMSRLSMSQFGFAPNVKETAIEDEDIETKLGLIPDVLEELKSIFHILDTEHGGKEDFISLFSLVSSKYLKIRNTSNQQALNDYIRENLAFEISDEELDILWI